MFAISLRLGCLTTLITVAGIGSAPFATAPPRLTGIFPCGARQGTTAECTVSGTDIDNATGLLFSHPDITAQLIGPNKFKVTVGSDVPLGQYDSRVVTPAGVSNFRAFVVGDWLETLEQEPNNQRGQAQRVTLPVVVNGKMDAATDVDHFIFTAKKGQRILINCWASRIDSKMEGCLRVSDAQGRELAYSGNYYGKDPFIDCTVPDDGDYTIRVWDLLYGGGPEYGYRLHIGALPHIDAIVPAAIQPGVKTTVTVYGRNLPDGKPAPAELSIHDRPLEMVTCEIEGSADTKPSQRSTALRPSQAALDGMDFRLRTPQGSSNPLFVGFTSDQIVTEREPNNDLASAHRVPVPCEVSGTFGQPGDVDYYAFAVQKGERIVVEMIGERLGGFVDPVVTAFDSAGKPFSLGNPTQRNIGQNRFNTTTNDPRYEFTARADAEIFLQVRDQYYQQRGGPHFTYRLSIRRQRPDFQLVVLPANDIQPEGFIVGRGGRQRLDVLAFRHDGFDGPITVTASDLPAGVTCDPVTVGPGLTTAPLIFQATKDTPQRHAAIRVTGTAMIGATETVKTARGGGLVWPAKDGGGGARLSDNIVLAVGETAPFTLTAELAQANVKAGEKLQILAKIERVTGWAEDVQLSGIGLPQGFGPVSATVPKDAGQVIVELAVPANLRPGTYTFALNGAGPLPREAKNAKDAKELAGVRVVYPSNLITITVAGPAAKK